MTRERLVAAALATWPEPVRAERGTEMADTLLEASDTRARFVREIVALAWRGLGARAATPGVTKAAFIDGVRLAGGMFLVLFLAASVHAVPFAGSSRYDGQLALLAGGSLLALAGRDRWAGAGLLALVLWRLATPPVISAELPVMVVQLGCAGTMIAAARPVRRRPWLLATAAVLIPLALTRRPGPLEEGAAILALASLLTLAGDPRPAIACAVVALPFGVALAAWSQDPRVAAVLLVLAPLTLLAAAVRARTAAVHTPLGPGVPGASEDVAGAADVDA